MIQVKSICVLTLQIMLSLLKMSRYVWNNIHNRIILTIFVICIHRRSAMGWWASGPRHSITDVISNVWLWWIDGWPGEFYSPGTTVLIFPMRWDGLAGGNRHFSVQGRRKVWKSVEVVGEQVLSNVVGISNLPSLLTYLIFKNLKGAAPRLRQKCSHSGECPCANHPCQTG